MKEYSLRIGSVLIILSILLLIITNKPEVSQYVVTYCFDTDSISELYTATDSVDLTNQIEEWIDEKVVDRDIYEFPIDIIVEKVR
jgi:hypothetical protein